MRQLAISSLLKQMHSNNSNEWCMAQKSRPPQCAQLQAADSILTGFFHPGADGQSHCRTELHFVRCVKPNAAQVPSTFDASLVLHQLRCCGVLEVTRIARAGYPTRYLRQDFADRYGVLLTPKASGKSRPPPPPPPPLPGLSAPLPTCAHTHIDICAVLSELSLAKPWI